MAKLMKRGARATKLLKRVRRDLSTRRPAKKRSMTKANAPIVLAQGTLQVPKRNFGTRVPGTTNVKSLIRCLDARVPRTLGLPRAVGPYSVIRTSRLFSSASPFVMFSTFRESSRWLSWCAIETNDGTQDVTGTNNTKATTMPMDELGAVAEAVPAAMTVQVMNPAAVQTAHGVFAMTRVNQQLHLGDSPAGTTYNNIRDRVISFYSPRLLTGGRLALRGVKCSSYPLDMSQYSEFSGVEYSAGTLTLDSGIKPGPLAPIVFCHNQENSFSTVEFLVTIEWRVRFDPGNPATSSHTFHPTLADSAWNAVVCGASAAGHGVEDVGEEAASGLENLGEGAEFLL